MTESDCAIVEEWRPVHITHFSSRYSVSNLGRVRSNSTYHRKEPYGIIKPSPNHSGYLSVGLRLSGVTQRVSIARLVLNAFIGPCPDDCEALHGPGGRQDNRIVNLSWGTHKQNCADKLRDGTSQHGERNGVAVLTDQSVREILAISKHLKWSQTRIANGYGIERVTVSSIVTGRAWKHIERNGIQKRPSRKLTPASVREIRAIRRILRWSLQKIATGYHVSVSCIHQVVRGERWRTVT